MITPISILAAALVATSIASAQSVSDAEINSPATLGTGYASAVFVVSDLRHYSSDWYEPALDINCPIHKCEHYGFDAKFSYAYGWLESRPSDHINALDLGLTAYRPLTSRITPYINGTIGRYWYPGDAVCDYSGEVGAQFSLTKRLGLTAYVQYSDAFRHNYEGVWVGGLRANYRITRHLDLGVVGAYQEYGDISYGAGFLWRL